jgi:hypothetical protein
LIKAQKWVIFFTQQKMFALVWQTKNIQHAKSRFHSLIFNALGVSRFWGGSGFPLQSLTLAGFVKCMLPQQDITAQLR